MSPARISHHGGHIEKHHGGHIENHHSGHIKNHHGDHQEIQHGGHPPTGHLRKWDENGYGSAQQCKTVKSEYKISADCTHRIFHQIKSTN